LRILEDIQITNLDYYAWRNFGSDIYYQVIRDNFEKVTDEAEVTDRRKGPGDPCPQASGNEQSADSDITTDAGKLDAYAKILAGMMLRKQFAKAPVQDILQRAPLGTEFISPKESLPGSGATDPRTKKEMLERNKSEDFAAARKFEAFTLLHTLPYIQGFLLYALATTYPFFALFLLLPGRAGGFLMWMALWAWAKSWDVGWAAIMTADEILWNLLPQASFFNPHNPAPYSSPVSLLEGAYDGDPSYSLATYWLLVCTMITGVPIVTAQAIIGTKTALANILLKGSTGLSDRMGTYARNYMAAAQTGRHEQLMGQKQTLGMMRRSSSMFDAALRAGNATSKAGESGPVSATAKASAAPLVGGAQLTGGLATDFWGTIQGMAQSDPLADTQSNPTIDAAVKGLNQSVEANRESANRFGE
ncbi:MAG TPA: hypothetical protein PLP17_15150, partial [Oligoflexia bacterium]|nr:hypothetical protein [Oligoflexia bacterium]